MTFMTKLAQWPSQVAAKRGRTQSRVVSDCLSRQEAFVMIGHDRSCKSWFSWLPTKTLKKLFMICYDQSWMSWLQQNLWGSFLNFSSIVESTQFLSKLKSWFGMKSHEKSMCENIQRNLCKESHEFSWKVMKVPGGAMTNQQNMTIFPLAKKSGNGKEISSQKMHEIYEKSWKSHDFHHDFPWLVMVSWLFMHAVFL